MNVRRSLLASAALVSIVMLSACQIVQKTPSHGSTGASGGTSPATSDGGAAAAGYKPVTDYTAYIGGKPGAADSKLAPVRIGVINQQGGSADIAPEWTIGAELAGRYINEAAGGIDGHPVELVTCFIPGVVANAAQCGQQMANDNEVQAVAVGAVAVGNEAMESALRPTGKPLVFGVATSPIDTKYEYGYVLFGDATHVEAPLATFAVEHLKAKQVAMVYPNIPGAVVNAQIIQAALQHYNVPIKAVGYAPTTTDLSGPLIAAGATTADLLINGSPSPKACSDIYKGIKQLNIQTPVLANVPCVSEQTKIANGGMLPNGWYYASANPLPGDTSDPSIAAFAAVANRFGQGKWAANAWTADAFAQVLTVAKWQAQLLAKGQQVTAKNLNDIAKSFKGPVPQGPPELTCGKFPEAPAVCNDKVSFFQNTEPDVFKPIARFIGPPEGFVFPKDFN